jgi:hypothetical protein
MSSEDIVIDLPSSSPHRWVCVYAALILGPSLNTCYAESLLENDKSTSDFILSILIERPKNNEESDNSDTANGPDYGGGRIDIFLEFPIYRQRRQIHVPWRRRP